MKTLWYDPMHCKHRILVEERASTDYYRSIGTPLLNHNSPMPRCLTVFQEFCTFRKQCNGIQYNSGRPRGPFVLHLGGAPRAGPARPACAPGAHGMPAEVKPRSIRAARAGRLEPRYGVYVATASNLRRSRHVALLYVDREFPSVQPSKPDALTDRQMAPVVGGLTPAQRWHLEVKGYVVVPGIVSSAHRAQLLSVIGEFRDALRQANPNGSGHGRVPNPRPNRVRRTSDGFQVVPPPASSGSTPARAGVAWVADEMPRGSSTVYTSLYGTQHADPAFEAYFEGENTVAIVEEILGQPRAPATLESTVAISRRTTAADPPLDQHPIEWHRGTGVESGTWTHAGLTHCSFVKALTVLQSGSDKASTGTLVVEGSHKVDVPTVELLALAKEGLRAEGTSELVTTVPMAVGDTCFFMETLLHAAPEEMSDSERIVIMGAWKPATMSHHPNLGGAF